MKIDSRVFLVTGGASGLGAATARMLVAAGGQVVIADLNREAGAALASALGPAARFIVTDVADEASGRAAVAAATSAFGALHGLVNCAGIGTAEKVLSKGEPSELATFARVVQINLIGTFNLIRLAAAALASNDPNEAGERGVIVNTASVAAFEGQMGQAAYAASKGGVVAMTLPIARELGRYGIRVMAIAPGIIETPLLLGLPQEVRNSLGSMIPFPPRPGQPAEFASLVRHIMENAYLNGEVIRLDGAIRMGAKQGIAGMVLSDLGAAVVRINRATEPNAPEINLFSPDQNIPDRGQRLLQLDLKAPASVAAALRTKTRGRTSPCVTRRHLR